MLHVLFQSETQTHAGTSGDSVYASTPPFEPSWSKFLVCVRLGEEGETLPS